MDTHSGDLTAADVVNNLSVEELADIIETVGYPFCNFRLSHTYNQYSMERIKRHTS